MIDLKHLKKTQRIHTDDKRNFKLGLRADRNEKVVDWPANIFKKIFTKIKPHEFTAYYNTTEIKKIKKQVARYFSLKEEKGRSKLGAFREFKFRCHLNLVDKSDKKLLRVESFKALSLNFSIQSKGLKVCS